MRNSYKILVGKPKGNRPLENLDEDGRITFNQFNIYGVCVWTAFN
jgi:hypothetical protein